LNIFPFKKKKEFFTAEEQQLMVEAIQKAERRTSGEVRVFVESKCRFVYAIDRAHEIFFNLKMHETELRNATLIYVAVDDRQAAVYGDNGIFQKVGSGYWSEVVEKMLLLFRQKQLAGGICQAIGDLGEALSTYFPYNQETDKNELPDELIFGR
jgi:uncharacterized membrane protein